MPRQTSTSLRFLRKSVDLEIAVKALDSQVAGPLTVPVDSPAPETGEAEDSLHPMAGDPASEGEATVEEPVKLEDAIAERESADAATIQDAVAESAPVVATDSIEAAARSRDMDVLPVEQEGADSAQNMAEEGVKRGSALARPWRWLVARFRNAIYRSVTRRVVAEIDHSADIRMLRFEDRLKAAVAEAVAPVRGDVLWLHSAVREVQAAARDIQERLDQVELGIRGDVLWLHSAARDVQALVERAEHDLRADIMWLHHASRELRVELDRRFGEASAVKDDVTAVHRALDASRERLTRELGIKVVAETNYLRLQLQAALEALESDMEARFDAHILPLVERFDANQVKGDESFRQISKAMHADIADARTTIVNQLTASLSKLPARSELAAPLAGALDRIETYALQAARRGTTSCGPWVMVRTAVGYVLCPETDTALIASLIDSNELEPGTRTLIEQLLNPGDCFIDIGANIGLHTIAAARRVGPDGGVFAFEPFPASKEALDESLWLNGLSSRVSVAQLAIFSRAGEQNLFLGRTSGHHSLFSEVIETPTEHSVLVTTATLDSVIPAGQRVDLIKIDVEGAELEVLKGARRVLDENPRLKLIVEFGLSHLEHRGLDPMEWIATFQQAGFRKLLGIDEATGEVEPMTSEQIIARQNINLLLTRDLGTSDSV